MTNGQPEYPDLAGKVAMITGASRGIGRAVARAFSSAGTKLILMARSEELDAVVSEVGNRTDVVAEHGDVGSFDDVQRTVEAGLQRFERIDILVNAAAVLGPSSELWTTDPCTWFETLRVNLFGTYSTMRSVMPSMIEQNRGKVINFAGGGAAYGYPRFSAYAASKVSVVRMTETVAQECAAYNIQVNAIAPGAIETDMLRAVRAAGGEIRSVGSMDQAVAVVLFLASDASDHISGRFIHAKDSYNEFPASLPADYYTLRRIQP
jgi:3-oxoacyl-[acyl-carrier protein] reductase